MNRAPIFVRVRRVEGAPVVAVRVLLPGGARRERIAGQAYLAGRMLAEGTRAHTWDEVAHELEARGMVLATAGTFETLSLGLDALASDWRLAVDWAAELSLSPTFPRERFEWLRKQIGAEIESLGDQPEVRTAWDFLEQLYTPHPRARRLQGDPESLAELTPEACADLHAAGLARGAIITVAGEIDEEAVRTHLRERFEMRAELLAGEGEPPKPEGGAPRRTVRLRDADQAHLYLGHPTVRRGHPDEAALDLLAVVLGSGSGLTGRIPNRVREKEGLAYTTYAQTAAGAGLDPGRLVAYVGTSPETVARAEACVREELDRLLEDGVSDDELEEARSYLIGREPFRRETARQWAELLAESIFYELPVEDPRWWIERLRTPDRPAVEAAARRHIRPAELKVTVGLPEE